MSSAATTARANRPAAPVRPSAGLLWLALGIVYIVWGSTYLAIKVAVETLPPLAHAGVRFLTAGLLVLGVLALTRRTALRVSRSELATVSAAGALLLLGGNGLVAIAEERVASGFAALIIAAVPLWIVLLRAASGDRPTRATVTGVAVGFAGVALLLTPAFTGGFAIGHALLAVAASLSWAAGSYLATRRPMPANPFAATGIEMVCGGVALLVMAAVRGEFAGFSVARVSAQSWAALGYLIVFGSLVAFTSYVWLLGHAPVSQVATYAYVNPAVAVALGAVLLGEPVTPTVLAGGLIILVAVAVVVAEEGRRQRRARTRGGLRAT